MRNQNTNTVLMIRPTGFNYNDQTAVNNHYQKSSNKENIKTINISAQKEFDSLVEKLTSNGISVLVFNDDNRFDTPDSIFPNNWISFHQNGDIGLYPMFAENRRLERREDIFDFIEKKGFQINNIIDYSEAEIENIFLEGTGSMVLDRENDKAFCAISQRSHEDLLIEFCEDFEFTPVIFNAFQDVDGKRKPIYHTNVMMCIADKFVVICLDSIDDENEKKNVISHFKADNKEIIEISELQVNSFAGNMLQLRSSLNKSFLIMSESAYKILNDNQISRINKYCPILYSSLETIENYGGGSARCMMAEVFLPKSKSV